MIARSGHDQKWNFFATLGLMPPCTVEDVKQAYLAKATKAHPDTGGDVESFKQLQEAYKQGTEYARSHSILTSWFKSSIKRYVHREHLVDELRRLGGRVDIKKSECSRQEVGEDFAQIFDKLVGIHLHGQKIGDEVLEYLMSQRAVLVNLRLLDLAESHITDEGLKHLRYFKNLRQLDLRDTRVTNRRLELLRRLPKLQWLAVKGTHVSRWGYLKLWWHFPNLRVVTS